MTRVGFVVVLGLVACVRPPAAPPGPSAPPPSVATPEPTIPPPSSRVVTPAADGSSITPAQPPFADAGVIETGLPAGAVVGWPVDLEGAPGKPSVVLFPDEKTALRRAVAAALEHRGIAVLPIAEVERIEDAAAAGTLVLEGDQRCASPLTRSEVHSRYFDDRRFVSVRATCVGGCRLEVSVVTRGTLDTPETIHQELRSRRVEHPEDPAAWIAAASQLADVRPKPPASVHSEPRRRSGIHFDAPSVVGRWSTSPATPLSALDGRLVGCAHVDPMLTVEHEMRAKIDATGRVSRCSVHGAWGPATPDDRACLCGVLGELRVEPGADNRRLRVRVVDDGRAPSRGVLLGRQGGTGAWSHRVRSRLVIERCGASHPPSVRVDAIASLRLAEDGTVEDVRIDGNIVDRSAMEWARCVVGELQAMRFPCRPPGIDVLRISLILDTILARPEPTQRKL